MKQVKGRKSETTKNVAQTVFKQTQKHTGISYRLWTKEMDDKIRSIPGTRFKTRFKRWSSGIEPLGLAEAQELRSIVKVEVEFSVRSEQIFESADQSKRLAWSMKMENKRTVMRTKRICRWMIRFKRNVSNVCL